jgi:hypothetical protein
VRNYRTNVIPDANANPDRRLYERNGSQRISEIVHRVKLGVGLLLMGIFFCEFIEDVRDYNAKAPARAEYAYQVQQADEAHEWAALYARYRTYNHKRDLYAFYHPNRPQLPPFDETQQP